MIFFQNFFSYLSFHVDPKDRLEKTKPLKRSLKNSKQQKNIKKPSSRWRKQIIIWILNGLLWSIITLFLIGIWFAYDLPDVQRLENITRRPSVTLLTRQGSVLATYGDLYGSFVKSSDLPFHVPAAIIAIEDRRFFDHFGIDMISILRAAWANYRAGSVVQGGSTLTQQLAKNFLLSEKLYVPTDRSFRRKIQEILLAFWLEKKFSKNQILTIYLNRVYLGSGVYGIQAAAYKYFGKSARDLTIYEAAVIAGLLKAPSRYSPLSNPNLASQRAQVVLLAMQESGFISSLQRNAFKDSITLNANPKTLKGRYFADWIIETLDEYIGPLEEDVIVKTTYDERLQTIAEDQTKLILEKEGPRLKISQAALVAMTPDGGVRAMVGGLDYKASQFNRVTQAYRQIGSSFKFFTFLCALEKGKLPSDYIKDTLTHIGKWRPGNYKYKSKGEVSLTDGFAYSVNGVAVRLAVEVGLKKLQEMPKRLGLRFSQPNDMTISLGSGQSSLLELTAAYGAVANHGFGVWPYGILEVSTVQNKKILYKRKSQGAGRVLSGQHVINMTHMMQAAFQYGTGKAAYIDRPCAGKTGTSQNYRDAWSIGFTPDLVTGVWMGNDNGQYMKEVTGGKTPAQLWHEFMKKVHEGYPIHYFPTLKS